MRAERLGPVKACFTEGPGHATALARELADAGCDLLIVAGGDGTLNEVVNGILMRSSGPRVAGGVYQPDAASAEVGNPRVIRRQNGGIGVLDKFPRRGAVARENPDPSAILRAERSADQ